MSVFPENMNQIDLDNPEQAIKTLDDYIRYMVERIEHNTVNMTKVINEAGISSVEMYILVAAIGNDVAALTSLVNSHTSTISTLQGNVSTLTADVGILQGDISTINNTLISLDQRVTALEQAANGS